MEFLGKVGLNLQLFVAQAINFLILLAILARYLYRPLMNAVDERERKNRETEENFRNISEKRARVSAELEAERREQEERVRVLLEDADGAAKRLKREQAEQSLAEFDEIVRYAQKKASEQETAYIASARDRIAGIAMDVTARLIRGTHGREADRALRHNLEAEILRRDWSDVRALLEERPLGRVELDEAKKYLVENLGPMPLTDRDVAAALRAHSPAELQRILEERLGGVRPVGAEVYEGLRNAVRPGVLITAAFPLPVEELTGLVRILEEQIGLSLASEVKIDRSMLGGISVEVSGVRLDGTLAGRLQRLVAARTA